MALTAQQQRDLDYIKAFSLYNPQVPINWKAEPSGYANYLRTILINMHASGGSSYKDPARMPPIDFNPPTITTPFPTGKALSEAIEDLQTVARLAQNLNKDILTIAYRLKELQ